VVEVCHMTAKQKTIPRHASWPAWARYYTVDFDGVATIWKRKPTLVKADYLHGSFWLGKSPAQYQKVPRLDKRLTQGATKDSLRRILT
jgi:hypothetical protein